jgi:hypothetical protein
MGRIVVEHDLPVKANVEAFTPDDTIGVGAPSGSSDHACLTRTPRGCRHRQPHGAARLLNPLPASNPCAEAQAPRSVKDSGCAELMFAARLDNVTKSLAEVGHGYQGHLEPKDFYFFGVPARPTSSLQQNRHSGLGNHPKAGRVLDTQRGTDEIGTVAPWCSLSARVTM